MTDRATVSLCVAALAAAFAMTATASAQTEDQIRAQCIDDAGADYLDSLQSEHHVGRKQRYINCMLKHGIPY